MCFRFAVAYENKVDFVEKLVHALTNEPIPLSEELSYIFTWEAATERLIQNSAVTMSEGRYRAKVRKASEDDRIAKMYNRLGIRGHGWGGLLGASKPSPNEAHQRYQRHRSTMAAETVEVDIENTLSSEL